MTKDMPEVETFRMNSLVRAEAASKDLKKILADVQRPMVLGKCREAVARMYGYAGWRALTGAPGGAPSPDDAEAGDDVRSARHDHQIRILMDIGLDRPIAETVRSRLSPTGRGGEDTALHRPIELSDTAQYHPERQQRSIIAVERDSDLSEDESLMGIFRAVDEWIGTRALLPLDDMALHIYRFEALYDPIREILDGRGRILDASVVAAELAGIDLGEGHYAGEWKGMPTTYVHLGTNAFPSPWPGCGIEGCYIKVSEPGLSTDEREIEVIFVVSQEYAPDPGLGIGEDFLGFSYQDFIQANRHINAYATAELDEDGRAPPIRLADVISGLGKTEHEAPYVEAWKPYLLAPFTAAWNALRAWKEGTLPIRYGLLSDMPEDLFAAMARARTEKQRERLFKRASDEDGYIVQFLGGIPVEPTRGPIREVDFPYPEVADPEDWAAGYLEMAAFAGYPSVRLHLARKALAVLAKTDAGEHVNAKVRASINEEAALSELGRWDEALAAARRCLAFDVSDGPGTRFRLASLLIRNDDEAGGRDLLARYETDPVGGSTLLWAKALLLARFGTPEQAKTAVAQAVAEAPHVRDRLLGGDGHPERWYDLGMYDYIRDPYGDRARAWEAYAAAGMLRDGWTALPDHRSLIG
jgi:tetratricopeptide (TPR) repeat protein